MLAERINTHPMSAFQLRVVAICFVLFTSEGYDILVMAFAASGVVAEWGVTSSEIGFLMSSGFIGMAFGSAFLAPLADRIGRRPLSLWCLIIATFGMAAAAVSFGPWSLGFGRLLTGLGAGGLIASLPVLITEYTPQRRRGTMIALYTCGMPLGGVLAGLVASAMGPDNWRGLFVAGAVLTTVLLGLAMFAMPESLHFLIEKRPINAKQRINQLLHKMNLEAMNDLPERVISERSTTIRTNIFGQGNWVRTFSLWVIFFVMMSAFYFATSWMPLLLENAGFSAEQGVGGGLLLNIGGVVATLTFSLLAILTDRRKLTSAAFVVMAAVFVIMSFTLNQGVGVMLVMVLVVGFSTNMTSTGMLTVIPDAYPASVRTTAVGWATACGRLGAITAPAAVGLLIDSGWSTDSLFQLFALPSAVCGIWLFVILTRTAGTQKSDEDSAKLQTKV